MSLGKGWQLDVSLLNGSIVTGRFVRLFSSVVCIGLWRRVDCVDGFVAWGGPDVILESDELTIPGTVHSKDLPLVPMSRHSRPGSEDAMASRNLRVESLLQVSSRPTESRH